MNRVAVDDDWKALLCCHLAEALQEDKDGGRLCIVEAGIVADNDVVEEDIDVWHLVRVKWCHKGV